MSNFENTTATPTTIRITEYSLLDYSLKLQEQILLGYRVDLGMENYPNQIGTVLVAGLVKEESVDVPVNELNDTSAQLKVQTQVATQVSTQAISTATRTRKAK
jgi:hypothetical protein